VRDGEVEVEVEERRGAGGLRDDQVGVPDLVEERARRWAHAA